MKFSAAVASAMFGVTLAQGVTNLLTPTGAAPAGCTGSFNGPFGITVQAAKKRSVPEDIQRRGVCDSLAITLNNGITKDKMGRTGYIAANYQFQFDGPPQTGAIITGGFSVCPGNMLALGSSTTFYQCLSGNFYNLYDRNWAAQCEPVNIIVLPCDGSSSGAGGGGMSGGMSGGGGGGGGGAGGMTVGTATVISTVVTVLQDGQPQVVTSMVPVPLCQIGDGQVQVRTTPCASLPVTTAKPANQISDGQIQVSTKAVNQISDGQIQVSKPAASQISDGQIQVPTKPAASQISDGQIQVPTKPAASQISDGQIQVPTKPAVTQISDGQIQAPTKPAVTQISDGQIQAPTKPAVSQISDGQLQVPPATLATNTTASRPTTPAATPSRVVQSEATQLAVGSFAVLIAGLLVTLAAI